MGGLLTVQGDRTQLRALLQDLVANAATFVWEDEAPDIAVAARRLDGGWRVEVAGIGLATCKRVVEAHGGQVGLEGREGGGTVVWCELPDAPLPAD